MTLVREVLQERLSLQTTDSTTTTIWQFTVPSLGIGQGCTATVQAIVTGHRPLAGTGLIWDARSTYTRLDSDPPTFLGQLVKVNQKSITTWSAAFDLTGNVVRLRVTGVAGQTIEWFSDVTVHIYGFN